MSTALTPYTPELAATVRDFAEHVARADGVEAFGEQTLFNLAGDAADHFLITGARGAVVGYAQLDRGSAELAVHPDHRRAGVGGALLDAVKTRAPEAAIWAHGNLPAAQGIAASRNLAVTRELVYMRAELEHRDIPSPPPGIALAAFTEADGADWVALNAQAFAEHPEQGRLTADDLAERMAQPWFDPNTFWLSRGDDGELLGYMWVKREPQSESAEIYVLGVSPAAQGRGLGRYLTEHALAAMAESGVREMDLYVEGDNTPALATYTRYGFTRAVTHVQYA